MGDEMNFDFLSGLLNKINAAEDEAYQEKKAQFAKMGREIYAVYDGLVQGGFSPEMAFEMIKTLMYGVLGGKRE